VYQFWDEWAVIHVDSWLCHLSLKVHEVFDNSTECNSHLPLFMSHGCTVTSGSGLTSFKKNVSWTLNTFISYSADTGIATNTTSNFSSTCVVLTLVAGRQNCQPQPNSQQQTPRLFLSSFQIQHFYMTVNMASEMHFNAFNASRSLTQPLFDCMLYLTQYLYDPGISPSSAN